MEQIIEFAGNHPLLVGAFFALVIALIITETRRGGQSLSPQQMTMLVNKSNGIVLDIRDASEYSQGHIVDSIHIPYTQVEKRIGELESYKDRPIIIVCKMGQHSGLVGSQLRKAGFGQVSRLSGGISEWKNANLPLVKS